MKTIAKSALLCAGILLSLTGCQKGATVGGGKDVKFQASTNTHETRISYGDEVVEGGTTYERLDWVSGDKLLIWSDNAVVREGLTHPSFTSNNTNIATYSIAGITTNGRKSIATISDPAGRGLRYLDDDSQKYAFWGIYPADAVTTNPSTTNSAVLSIPNSQEGNDPDMSKAYMTAVALNTQANVPVDLEFNPAFTAFEFTVETDSEETSLEISKFTIESEGEDGSALAGIFTASCTNGTWAYDCSDEDNTYIITVNFPDKPTVKKGTPLVFRFFALPQDIKNVRITFWTSEGVKSTKLLLKGGDYVTFGGTLLHKIKGLVLPTGMYFSYITLDLQVLEWEATDIDGTSAEFPQTTQFSVTGAKNGRDDLGQGESARQTWYFMPGQTIEVHFKVMLPAGGTWEVVPMGGTEANPAPDDLNNFTITNVSPAVNGVATVATNLYGPIGQSGSTDVKLQITYNGTDSDVHSLYFLTYAYSGANKGGVKYSIDSDTQLYDQRGYHTFIVNSPDYNN